MSFPRLLTKEYLKRDVEACASQVRKFNKLFPDGVRVNKKNWLKFAKEFDINYLLGCGVLDWDLSSEFQAENEAAYDMFSKSIAEAYSYRDNQYAHGYKYTPRMRQWRDLKARRELANKIAAPMYELIKKQWKLERGAK